MFPELLVMLRNRSRSVTSKQAIVPDHNTTSKASQNQNNNHNHNHNHNQTTAISSVFLTDSSRFFNGVLPRSLSDAMTPKSILDHKKFSNFVNNPFLGYTNNMNKNKQTTSTVHHKLDSEAIGLAIIDEINKGNNNICKPKRKIMFFGAKLEVQVPLHDDDISAFTLSKSKSPPKSPAEFGIKNRNSRMLSHSGSFGPVRQSKTTDEKLSLTDMELLEDYTCVIIHGQNPKTIHIFDDCIVDSCSCSSVGLPQLKNKHGCGSSPRNSGETHSSFLSICSTCKNKLLESDDIFIYRGDKAFCSDECRGQEMLSQGYED